MADQAGQQDISIKEGSFPRPTTGGVHIKRGITSFDVSRRKKHHPTALPWCLMDQAHHHSAKHAASSTQPTTEAALTINAPTPSRFTTDAL